MKELSWIPLQLTRHRRWLAPLGNAIIIGLAYTAAFLVRFDLTIPDFFQRTFLLTLPATIGIHYAAFYIFKVTRGWWRYVSVTDFINTVRASVLGGLGLATYVLLFHRGSFYPRGVFFLNLVMVIGLSIGARLIVRLLRRASGDIEKGARKRLLIVGAGDMGERLVREIREAGKLRYRPMAFVDDDPNKRGMYLDGVPVVSGISGVPDAVKRWGIEEIIIAMPTASGQEVRSILDLCRKTGLPVKVMPATFDLLYKGVLPAPREVDINDLLRRPPIKLDTVGIGRFLTGKRVLVTGAAGSIGAEIVRQVLVFRPSQLICLDHDENALFFLERGLGTALDGVSVAYRLGDITDAAYMEALFAERKPDVVFHAAAHKHVGVLESNPIEGVRNNVFGTETVATLAGRYGATAFVLISSDKAVNPSSVMGTTKRIAELLIQALPFSTRYTAVRFGNVLGSQGSVVPLLKEQIAAGGPVTVTHPDMRRFFMTIPEAVQLVIQAAAMGDENEVFMLDMGEPVKILDLTNDLIQLSGLRPGVDIEIVFTGARPGEKLFEELYLDSEHADATTHPKILVARRTPGDEAVLRQRLIELRRASDAHDEASIRRLLPVIVPEYKAPPAAAKVIQLPVSRASSADA